jgi:hypothetical protein
MLDGWPESISKFFGTILDKVRVGHRKSAVSEVLAATILLTPILLWFATKITALTGAVIWLLALVTIVILTPIFTVVYLLLKHPTLLQSETYRIQEQRLQGELFAQGRGAITDPKALKPGANTGAFQETSHDVPRSPRQIEAPGDGPPT